MCLNEMKNPGHTLSSEIQVLETLELAIFHHVSGLTEQIILFVSVFWTTTTSGKADFQTDCKFL